MNGSNGIKSIIAAYRRDLAADVMQIQVGGEWGPYWTIPPYSPSAMERAARQANRSRAARLRHWRRARLTNPNGQSGLFVVLTVLPEREQSVFSMKTGKSVVVRQFLADESLKVLMENFVPYVKLHTDEKMSR